MNWFVSLCKTKIMFPHIIN